MPCRLLPLGPSLSLPYLDSDKQGTCLSPSASHRGIYFPQHTSFASFGRHLTLRGTKRGLGNQVWSELSRGSWEITQEKKEEAGLSRIPWVFANLPHTIKHD